MYALRDKEFPGGFGLLSYHRTLEEAKEAQKGHVKNSIHPTETRAAHEDIPGVEWTEIVEVEREDRPCRYCGEQVQAKNPETDYCRTCFYTGRSQADSQEVSLAMLREIPTAEDASVWHTGGGCFCLGVTFPDGASLMVSNEACITDENGEPLDPNEAVWHAGYYTDEDDSEGFAVLDGEWRQGTIPEIVAAMTTFLADPDRYKRMADQLEDRAAVSAERGFDTAAEFYRAHAAVLRAKEVG